MAHPWRDVPLDAVVGIESRGFILGAALALCTGFVPVRKPGKLPARTLSLDYALEYGSDRCSDCRVFQLQGVPAGS